MLNRPEKRKCAVPLAPDHLRQVVTSREGSTGLAITIARVACGEETSCRAAIISSITSNVMMQAIHEVPQLEKREPVWRGRRSRALP